MGMQKSYSIGTTATVIDLKSEFQGGNYGARGQKRVRINFNADDIYFESGKFAKTSEKVYTASNTALGTGVDESIATIQVATAVDYDLHDGLNVMVRDGSSDVGVAKIIYISKDRKTFKLAKVEQFDYPTGIAVVLNPSARFMNGNELEYNFDSNSVISLIAGTAGTDNVTITLLDSSYGVN